MPQVYNGARICLHQVGTDALELLATASLSRLRYDEIEQNFFRVSLGNIDKND